MKRFAAYLEDVATVREAIDEAARTRGEDVFLISPEAGRVLTYSDLRVQSRAISARLRQSGLVRGDKVAFLSDNGLFTVQLFFGTMYSSLVSVPLNVRAGVAQLAYTLQHCDAKLVFVENQYEALAKEALGAVDRTIELIPADVDALATESVTSSDDGLLAPPESEDLALLMYTSGSVGQPKAAMHSHRTLLAHGRNSIQSHKLSAEDRSLLVLPVYHINAECVTLMPTMLSGGSVVVPHGFSVSHYWDWLEEYRCTWSAVVPTIIAQLLDWKDSRAEERKASFGRVRFIRSSSAPLSPSMQREFLEKFDILLIQAMGSSEAGNVFANPQPPGENKIGTPGLAWGFETRIINSEGDNVRAGEAGEVLIRGAAVMQGYYKDAAQTEAVLDGEGWLHTGDLAYQDRDGYFFVIGRSKELIIKGGVNIAPRQIDEVLESHPAVLEAAVVGVPDRYVGEDLIAFAVLRSGATANEREILAYCESLLGHFKTPTRVHFVSDLPKGPSGKIQRLRLLDDSSRLATPLYRNNVTVDAQLAVTSEEIGRTISDSWTEVLGEESVEPHLNFFALGGDSLKAVQCVSKIREKLLIALSLSDFFENPTVAELTALVKKRLDGFASNGTPNGQISGAPHDEMSPKCASVPDLRPIPPRGDSSPYPLTPGQQRVHFFQEMAPGVPLYNECDAVRLMGELDADALEQAFNLVIARHEILRTTIEVTDEQPIAIVHDSWPLHLKRVDLAALPRERRDSEVERLLIEEPRLPYDLKNEPGIRVTLLRLGSREHVLILMMHHLVCDWTSLGVLWRELSAAYRSICRSEPIALPSLPIQHGDLAVWQLRMLEKGFQEDLEFWEENLRGAPELLELPSDRPRPIEQSYGGAHLRHVVDSNIADVLREYSRAQKTSLFTVFAAAFNVLLHRYTGADDIVVGIPMADRERQEAQSVMGFLLQTHVLRTRLSADLNFRDLLPIVQKGLVALYSHREVPFDQVVSRIRPDRSLSHSPIFQVMINWRDREQQLSYVGLDGLVVESLLAETRTSKFDFTLLLTDSGSDVMLEAEYSTDLFDEATVQRWLENFVTLLSSVANCDDQPISALPLLSQRERNLQIVEWNNTHAEFPADRCVHQLIEEQAARTPDRIAVIFEDDQLTYAKLNLKADRLAAYLRKRGAKPGALVGVMVERSLNMVIALLAVMKAGAAYVPIDPAYPTDRVSFVLQDAKAAFLLTSESIAKELVVPAIDVVCIDGNWLSTMTESCDAGPPASANDLVYVIYTSGSTGTPKGVEIPHRAVVNLLSAMIKKPGLAADDILVSVTTLSFDIANLELFLPLCVGAKLVIASHEIAADGSQLLQLLQNSGATVIQATPATYHLLIDAGWTTACPLKVLCGGEALSRELAEQILLRAGELWNMYGPTETTIWSSVIRVQSGDQAVPVGGPIENTQFYVLDTANQLVPIGALGELHIGGVGLARGYYNRAELTAKQFIPNPVDQNRSPLLYKTGDRARWRADGSIELLGRLDNQVKLRGFRIELEEIETLLHQHPAVKHCVVAVHEVRTGEKQLVGYIVPPDDGHAPNVTELRKHLQRGLPEYMVPALFVTLDKLPLTPNRKVDRKALSAIEKKLMAASESPIEPRTPVESLLTSIWCKILGLEKIGLRDRFFDLGGHSLLATRLLAAIDGSLNHKFSMPEFFKDPTIEGMAKILQESSSDQAASAERMSCLKAGRRPGTLFLLDAGLGLCQMAGMLNSELGLYATSVPISPTSLYAATLDFTMEVPSLESMATPHVKLIMESQLTGPYFLAGYSFGGVLAFEIAHQLQRAGVDIEMVLLLDAWAKLPVWWQKLKILSTSSDRPLNVRANHIWSKVLEMLPTNADTVASSSQDHRPSDGEWAEPKASFGDVPSEIYTDFFRKVRAKYQFKPLNSRATIFRCEDDFYSMYALNGKMGWEGFFARGVEVVDTPGAHFSLLQPPNLSELARRVDRCLANAKALDTDQLRAESINQQRTESVSKSKIAIEVR